MQALKHVAYCKREIKMKGQLCATYLIRPVI